MPACRVVVVDDDDQIATITSRILQDEGHEVTAFTSPAETIRWLATAQGVEVLITDVKMSGMNGVQLAAAARKLHPDVRVLLISGSAPAEPLALDGIWFVEKPFDIQTLLATFDRARGVIAGPGLAPRR